MISTKRGILKGWWVNYYILLLNFLSKYCMKTSRVLFFYSPKCLSKTMCPVAWWEKLWQRTAVLQLLFFFSFQSHLRRSWRCRCVLALWCYLWEKGSAIFMYLSSRSTAAVLLFVLLYQTHLLSATFFILSGSVILQRLLFLRRHSAPEGHSAPDFVDWVLDLIIWGQATASTCTRYHWLLRSVTYSSNFLKVNIAMFTVYDALWKAHKLL